MSESSVAAVKDQCHTRAESQRCHRSVTQNLYMVREHDRPPHRDFTWNPVSPCQVQVPGVPEIPGIIQAIYLEFQAHSRWTPGLIWLGFPAKSPPLWKTAKYLESRQNPGKVPGLHLDSTRNAWLSVKTSHFHWIWPRHCPFPLIIAFTFWHQQLYQKHT